MTLLAAAAAAVIAALAGVAWRRPLARRLALRQARRQPRDALLAVIGCALATAIITGSLLVGDTLAASMRARIPARLGPVDLVLRSYDPSLAEHIASDLAADPPPEIDGVLFSNTGEATLRSAAGSVVPGVRLLDPTLTAHAGFGGDPAVSGLSGPNPNHDQIVLNADAAAALGVEAGADVDVIAWGTIWTFRVVNVLPAAGVAGFAGEADTTAHNAFVAPGTVYRLAFAQELAEDARPPEHLVLISARGGVVPDGAALDAAEAAVRERIEVYYSTYDLDPVKRDLLRAAHEDAASFTELFASLGAFAVLAGCALLVTVVTTLAEQRRRTLGVLRAVGARRSDVVAALALEGAAYAVVAAAAGVLLGVLLAAAMVRVGGSVLASAWPGGLALRFAVTPSSLALGFLGGVIVSVATIAVASRRAGAVPIVAALAATPPPAPRPRSRQLVLLVAALLLTVAVTALGAARSDATAVLAASTLALAAAGGVGTAVLRRRGSAPRTLDAVRCAAAALVLGWALVAVPLLGVRDGDVGVFIVQGMVLAGAVGVLAVHAWTALGPLVARISGPAGAVLRLGLAAPARQPLRSGAVVLVYTLVVFVLAFSNILAGIFASQVDEAIRDEGGAFDVVVSTSSAAPLDPAGLAALDEVSDVATLQWQVVGFRVGSAGPFQDWALSGVDEAFVAGGPPPLDAVDPAFPDAEAAWRAVLADPGLAIADVAFLQRGGGPPEDNVAVGDTIEVRDPSTGVVRSRRVAGISAAGAAFSGVMVSRQSMVDLVEEPIDNRHYLALADGVDADAFATRLEQQLVVNGVEARSVEAAVREALDRESRFFDLIEAYLASALVIGVAALGVVTLRSVHERRREVAVLRALGFSPATVRAAFLVEPVLVALQGVVAGVGLALVSAAQLVARSDLFGDAEVSLTVPWTPIVVVVAIALLASLLAALPAARRATRLAPARVLAGDGA